MGSPERASAWDLVLEAGARQASGDTPARIERFLGRPEQARDGAGWRALARAQAAGGADPVDAWRRALAADPDDPEARAAWSCPSSQVARPRQRWPSTPSSGPRAPSGCSSGSSWRRG
ncbi:hypothetical protein [Nannocystis pusilla]|uniref:hypothetical protein n=1 Tax=Nannocystis pusilla TaxID=889268 RepID=UPI003B7E3202